VQVYVAKWHETLVAVKVLLDLEEAQQQTPEAAWTLSNPILHNLQKVGGRAQGRGGTGTAWQGRAEQGRAGQGCGCAAGVEGQHLIGRAGAQLALLASTIS